MRVDNEATATRSGRSELPTRNEPNARNGESLPVTRRFDPSRHDIWRRWRSLHHDILAHVRACERLGVELTVERLADELDEARGLVERRTRELASLQLVCLEDDGRVLPDHGARRMCG